MLKGHLVVLCEYQKQTLEVPPQDHLGHLALLCIELAYVNRVDIERVIDEFPSKTSRFKFFFQPIFRTKNVRDLF